MNIKDVYLAAPWDDKDLMPERALKVEAAGLNITHKWWITESKEGYAKYTPQELARFAEDDLYGVLNAEALILFSTSRSEGKAVEQGIAIAEGTPIIAIGTLGKNPNIFNYLTEYYTWVETLEEALDVASRLD